MPKGKIIVVSAPSGSGKSTLIKEIKQKFPDILESISTTTRLPREHEENGKHYFFVTKEEFLKQKREDDFIEWAEVHDNFYGTSKTFVETNLSQGNSVLFDIDVQGANNLKALYGDEARVIFILPPSLEELERRLRNRGTETETALNTRLRNARKEMEYKEKADFVLVNDDLEQSKEKMVSLVRGILEE
ncbi:MAG: guanylate kinase [Epsilonproteobacteria bacterium]|nr:MAG: guanylate kinase [Campylobacterota bacterium]RLA67940.1 MAG: guanylate kinase [Campylobacterota bacterium]